MAFLSNAFNIILVIHRWETICVLGLLPFSISFLFFLLDHNQCLKRPSPRLKAQFLQLVLKRWGSQNKYLLMLRRHSLNALLDILYPQEFLFLFLLCWSNFLIAWEFKSIETLAHMRMMSKGRRINHRQSI